MPSSQLLHAKDNICLAIILIVLFKGNSDPWNINFGIQPVELSPFNLDHYCVSFGDQLTLECSVQGGVATVWHGSAFDCISNSIILLHSQQSTGGGCNDEKIVAHSIGEFNNTYVSQLTVNVTEGMNNKTIECAADAGNGTMEVVMLSTLIIVDHDAIPGICTA